MGYDGQNEIQYIISELQTIDAAMEPLQERSRVLHRRLAELKLPSYQGAVESVVYGQTKQGPETVKFRDSDLSVRWNGGRLKFREDGKNAYRLFRLVFEAGEEGIAHEEAAERVFGDQCANLFQAIRSVKIKVENNGFPYELMNDGKFLKFLDP